jgi:acyl carrier protein
LASEIDDNWLFEGLKQSLEESLGHPIAELTPLTRLVGDLGLDSLDLLDLIFRLERRFKVRLNPNDYENKAKASLGVASLIEDGYYTSEALQELKKAMPCVPAEEFDQRLGPASLVELFRVQTFINMVSHSLKQSPGSQGS